MIKIARLCSMYTIVSLLILALSFIYPILKPFAIYNTMLIFSYTYVMGISDPCGTERIYASFGIGPLWIPTIDFILHIFPLIVAIKQTNHFPIAWTLFPIATATIYSLAMPCEWIYGDESGNKLRTKPYYLAQMTLIYCCLIAITRLKF